MQPCSAAASRPAHRGSGLLAGASILGLLALPAVPASAQYAAVVRSAAGLPTTGTGTTAKIAAPTTSILTPRQTSASVRALQNQARAGGAGDLAAQAQAAARATAKALASSIPNGLAHIGRAHV